MPITDADRRAAEDMKREIREALHCYNDGQVRDCDCPKPCALFNDAHIAAIITRAREGGFLKRLLARALQTTVSICLRNACSEEGMLPRRMATAIHRALCPQLNPRGALLPFGSRPCLK